MQPERQRSLNKRHNDNGQSPPLDGDTPREPKIPQNEPGSRVGEE